MLIFNFIIFMFFSGLISFFLNRKHLLMMLMIIEFLVLSLYIMLFMYMSYYMYNFFFLMIYITMMVCEGVLGLSMLVSMIRTHGSDYFQVYNILW